MNSHHEKAVQAIMYGHSCAMTLKLRLDDPLADGGPVSSYDLAKSIVDSFSNAISILTDTPKSEDDQFSDLSSSPPPPPPPPQESHSKKKRKIDITTNPSEYWRDDSPDPIYYDGYLWRKYGQKCIKQSNHQRSYYRCSYNKDHNCEARKHEQKIKDNPPVYRTTYFGHHTCNINHNQDGSFTAILEPVDDLKSANMIQFGNDLDYVKKNHSTGLSLSVKHEEDIIREKTVDHEYREITGDNQDCQHVIEEDLSSSPSGSYPPPSSSSDSDCIAFISDMLFEDLDSWDQFDFGLR